MSDMKRFLAAVCGTSVGAAVGTAAARLLETMIIKRELSRIAAWSKNANEHGENDDAEKEPCEEELDFSDIDYEDFPPEDNFMPPDEDDAPPADPQLDYNALERIKQNMYAEGYGKGFEDGRKHGLEEGRRSVTEEDFPFLRPVQATPGQKYPDAEGQEPAAEDEAENTADEAETDAADEAEKKADEADADAADVKNGADEQPEAEKPGEDPDAAAE